MKDLGLRFELVGDRARCLGYQTKEPGRLTWDLLSADPATWLADAGTSLAEQGASLAEQGASLAEQGASLAEQGASLADETTFMG
jgi:hypothetical protein